MGDDASTSVPCLAQPNPWLAGRTFLPELTPLVRGEKRESLDSGTRNVVVLRGSESRQIAFFFLFQVTLVIVSLKGARVGQRGSNPYPPCPEGRLADLPASPVYSSTAR